MRDTTPHDPRTAEGIKNGFSWCRKCGNTWNWKRPFVIPTRPDGGTFPICRDCAQGMTAEDILGHLKLFLEKEEREREDDLEYAQIWLEMWERERQGDEDAWQVKQRVAPHESTER